MSESNKETAAAPPTEGTTTTDAATAVAQVDQEAAVQEKREKKEASEELTKKLQKLALDRQKVRPTVYILFYKSKERIQREFQKDPPYGSTILIQQPLFPPKPHTPYLGKPGQNFKSNPIRFLLSPLLRQNLSRTLPSQTFTRLHL